MTIPSDARLRELALSDDDLRSAALNAPHDADDGFIDGYKAGYRAAESALLDAKDAAELALARAQEALRCADGVALQVESLVIIGPSHDGSVERDLKHLLQVYRTARAALEAGT